MLLDNLDDVLENKVCEALTEFDNDDIDDDLFGLESAELDEDDIEAILDGEDDVPDDEDEFDFESSLDIEEDFEEALESILYSDYDDYAEEGIFASKANKEKVSTMEVKELLGLFVRSKGEGAFSNNVDILKGYLDEIGVDGASIVNISGIPFAIVDDAKHPNEKAIIYLNARKKGVKTKASSLKKLRRVGARQLTKDDRRAKKNGGETMESWYDDYNYDYAMESDEFDFDDFGYDDYDDYAEEGLFRSKAAKGRAGEMDMKSLLEMFVEKKGEDYFIPDTEAIKSKMESDGVTDYTIVNVSGVPFAIAGDGAYYATKGRKVTKVKGTELKKLQGSAARTMTKADRKQSRDDMRAKVGSKIPFRKNKGGDEEVVESWYDDYSYDYFDDFDL